MMTPLLDVPAVRQRALPVTVEQYHFLANAGTIPQNTELLEGIVVEKLPHSPLHSSVLQKMLRRLQAIRGEKYEVRPEQPITCWRSEPEPDLALVLVSANDYAKGHPRTAELVIEIAVSSVEVDRRKAAIYAEAGVKEYWIVLPETRQIEVHGGVSEEGYSVVAVFEEGQTARSMILPEFNVGVSGAFPGLKRADGVAVG